MSAKVYHKDCFVAKKSNYLNLKMRAQDLREKMNDHLISFH
jgi:hypothetical protein